MGYISKPEDRPPSTRPSNPDSDSGSSSGGSSGGGSSSGGVSQAEQNRIDARAGVLSSLAKIQESAGAKQTVSEMARELAERTGNKVSVSKYGETIIPYGNRSYSVYKTGLQIDVPQGTIVDPNRAVEMLNQRNTYLAQQEAIKQAQIAQQRSQEAVQSTTSSLFETQNTLGNRSMAELQALQKLRYDMLHPADVMVKNIYDKHYLRPYTAIGKYETYAAMGLGQGDPDSYAKFKPGIINQAKASIYATAQRYIPETVPTMLEAQADIFRKQGTFRSRAVSVLTGREIYEPKANMFKEFYPSSLEFGAGYTRELRSNPSKTLTNTALFFALPGILKLGGRLLNPLITRSPLAVQDALPVISKSVSILIPAVYGTSVASRVGFSKTPNQEFGKIAASEITPMLVGGYAGVKVFPIAESYFFSFGRKKIPTDQIVSEQIRRGEVMLDYYNPKRHYDLFKNARNPIDAPQSNFPESALLTGSFRYKGKLIPYPSGQDLSLWVSKYGQGAKTAMYKTEKFQKYLKAKQSEKISTPLMVLHASSGVKQTAMSDIARTGKGTVMVGGDYLPGGFVAPSDKAAVLFLGLGKGNVAGEFYSSNLLNPYSTPKLMAIYPAGLRTRASKPVGEMSESGQPLRKFLGKDKPGVVDIPRIKTEPEGILPPGTQLEKTAGDYFFTWKGVRVPVDQFKVVGKAKTSKSTSKTFAEYSGEYITGRRSVTTPESVMFASSLSKVKPISFSSSVSKSKPLSSSSKSSNSGFSFSSSPRSSSSSLRSSSSTSSPFSSSGSSFTSSSSGSSSSGSSFSSSSSSKGSSSRSSFSSSGRSSSGSGSSSSRWYPSSSSPPPPEDKSYSSSSFGKRKAMLKKRLAFQTLVRRKGKWFAYGRPTEKSSALDIGTRYSKNTLGASFKIIPVEATPERITTQNEFMRFRNQFRDYQVRGKSRIPLKDTFIQMRSFRLSTPAEKREIKSAKFLKNGFRKTKSRWL